MRIQDAKSYNGQLRSTATQADVDTLSDETGLSEVEVRQALYKIEFGESVWNGEGFSPLERALLNLQVGTSEF